MTALKLFAIAGILCTTSFAFANPSLHEPINKIVPERRASGTFTARGASQEARKEVRTPTGQFTAARNSNGTFTSAGARAQAATEGRTAHGQFAPTRHADGTFSSAGAKLQAATEVRSATGQFTQARYTNGALTSAGARAEAVSEPRAFDGTFKRSGASVVRLEHAAVRFADRKLDGGPVFLGRINGSKPKPTAVRAENSKVTGVRVWTGDEASPQFTNFVVRIKDGRPAVLRVDNSK